MKGFDNLNNFKISWPYTRKTSLFDAMESQVSESYISIYTQQ